MKLTNAADIDLVVVNYKRYDLTHKFLKTFYENEPSAEYTLTVIDNEVEDLYNSAHSFDDYPSACVVSLSDNLSYSGGCNLGASYGQSKYIGLFNNDVEFVNNTCIDQCIAYMEANPDVGVTGPFQYATNKGGRCITHAGIIGPNDIPMQRGWMMADQGQYKFNEEVLMVMGSAMIIRREYWDKFIADPVYQELFPGQIGAFTPKLYYQDTALCYGAPRFGYKVVYMGEEGCELIHQWHQTIKSVPDNEAFKESQKDFRELMGRWNILCD